MNTHAEEHVSTNSGLNLIAAHSSKQFIFQLDGVNDHLFEAACYKGMDCVGLFDCSHGSGVLPQEWPWVADARIYGYAGGLGPHNVEVQIKVINSQRMGPGLQQIPYWIDMEGQIRDSVGNLDLGKVRKVLESSAPFVDVNHA